MTSFLIIILGLIIGFSSHYLYDSHRQINYKKINHKLTRWVDISVLPSSNSNQTTIPLPESIYQEYFHPTQSNEQKQAHRNSSCHNFNKSSIKKLGPSQKQQISQKHRPRIRNSL